MKKQSIPKEDTAQITCPTTESTMTLALQYEHEGAVITNYLFNLSNDSIDAITPTSHLDYVAPPPIPPPA